MRNREHVNKQYIKEAIGKARIALNQIENLEDENDRWFRRIDESIDDIASHLGIEIPYSLQNREWRYNAAYRLEMLAEKIKEMV